MDESKASYPLLEVDGMQYDSRTGQYELLSPFPYGFAFDVQEEMSFTPLISPAITPLIDMNNLSLYQASNLYAFSPLNSPALLPICNTHPTPPTRPKGTRNRSGSRKRDTELPMTPSQLMELSFSTTETRLDAEGEEPATNSVFKKVLEDTSTPYSKKTHKDAEQKRRDNLKVSFKMVKELLPPFKEKSPSKVLILKRGTLHLTFSSGSYHRIKSQ